MKVGRHALVQVDHCRGLSHQGAGCLEQREVRHAHQKGQGRGTIMPLATPNPRGDLDVGEFVVGEEQHRARPVQP